MGTGGAGAGGEPRLWHGAGGGGCVRPDLLVFDGTALLFRSYYGQSYAYSSPQGVEVGAVLGLCNTIQRILRFERPQRVAVVFDAGRKTFRNDLDERYKAQRGPPPDDLKPQFDLGREAVARLGFATSCVPGFEADDLMATLARQAREAGLLCRLLSVDKDLCQLVVDDDPAVVVEDPHGGSVWDSAGVQERMGVRPEQVVDYLSLVGDSSDNVPGVPGVGAKTAKALLAAFDSLDDIYRNLHLIADLPVRGSSKLGAKLEAGRSEAELARTLVTLRDDVELGWSGEVADATVWGGALDGEADRFFESLGLLAPLRAMRALTI